jgi:hypothetical protein
MIQTVTVLYQYQRRDGDTLVSTVDDYRIARQLLVEPVRRLLGASIVDDVKTLYRKLRGRFGDAVFTTTNVCEMETQSRQVVLASLAQLEAAGSVEIVAAGKGARPAQWKVTDNDPDANDVLPSADTIFRGARTEERNQETAE